MKKGRTIISVIVAAYMGVLFCYGLLNYPDAPIHPCVASEYCGKQGQPHTENEYHQFSIWQNLLFWSWPPGMLVLFLLNRDRIRRRGASAPQS